MEKGFAVDAMDSGSGSGHSLRPSVVVVGGVRTRHYVEEEEGKGRSIFGLGEWW